MSKHSSSVAIAIFSEDKQKVLLVKRRDVPVWVLPGGAIDPGESPSQAALREAQEETNYQIELAYPVGEYLPINRLGRKTYLFIYKVIGGSSSITDETRDISFFPINNLPKEIPPPYRDWIEDASSSSPDRYLKKKLTQLSYRKTLKLILLHPIFSLRFFLSRLGIPYNS